LVFAHPIQILHRHVAHIHQQEEDDSTQEKKHMKQQEEREEELNQYTIPVENTAHTFTQMFECQELAKLLQRLPILMITTITRDVDHNVCT
jgi:hypothetical protein